jgi:predicted metallo-beta-lactamase superfamily hydrolase
MMRLFKNITVTLMLLTMLAQTFSTLVVIGHYEMNRRYYAEVLCENKNRPELACEGKCVLMQKLNHNIEQKQERNNQSLQNFISQDFNWVFYEPKSIGFRTPFVSEIEQNISCYSLKNFIPQHHAMGLLRPPIA